MNTFEIKYLGNLRTAATHLDSGSVINTALASCILTIMAIAVEKNGTNIKGTNAMVKKTMGNNPRRIAKIDIKLTFPMDYDEKTKVILERAAHNCPVHHTLSNEVEKNIHFIYS